MKEITILFLTILGVLGSVSIYNKNKNVTVLKSSKKINGMSDDMKNITIYEMQKKIM